eukprot:scaffold24170_cov113-Cylindrotheca_fusiformis.AAC.2
MEDFELKSSSFYGTKKVFKRECSDSPVSFPSLSEEESKDDVFSGLSDSSPSDSSPSDTALAHEWLEQLRTSQPVAQTIGYEC